MKHLLEYTMYGTKLQHVDPVAKNSKRRTAEVIIIELEYQ